MNQRAMYFAKKVLKKTPFYWVYSKAQNHFQRKFRRVREKQEARLPSVSLSQAHVESCELLLDRSRLLSKLPDNGQVAEIGVAEGGFSSEILSETNPDTLHLIDSWDSERYQHGYEVVQSRFEREIGEGIVEVHRGFSTDVADRFQSNQFDWVYIDTDHSYGNTLAELRKYAPKIRSGGVIAGHDYTMGNWEKGYRYGVVEAVHEFCVHQDWKLIYLTADTTENRSFAIQSIEE